MRCHYICIMWSPYICIMRSHYICIMQRHYFTVCGTHSFYSTWSNCDVNILSLICCNMMMLFCVHHILSLFTFYTLWYLLLCLWCILYLFFNTVVYLTCSYSACLSACELSFKSLCCICLIFIPACINLVVSYGDLGHYMLI